MASSKIIQRDNVLSCKVVDDDDERKYNTITTIANQSWLFVCVINKVISSSANGSINAIVVNYIVVLTVKAS